MNKERQPFNVLLTQNIREFEFALAMVAKRLYVVDKAVRYHASPIDGVTFVSPPAADKSSFYGRFIKENDIDIVYVQSLKDVIFWGMLRFRYRLKCKVLVVSHTPYTWRGFRSAIPALIVAKVFSDAMIFISLREYCRFDGFCAFLRLKAFYIPNSVNVERFASKSVNKLAGRQLIVGCVSTVEPRKNQMFLAYLVAELQRRGVDCIVKIIGDIVDEGYHSKVLDKLKEFKIDAKFKFLGRVPYETVPNELNSFDVFVSPSISEMYPFSIVEAMLSGLPIVAFDVNGICDEVKDGYNGYLIQMRLQMVDQVRRWADCIEILTNDETRAIMGMRSRQLAMACNSPEALAFRFSNVVSSIMPK